MKLYKLIFVQYYEGEFGDVEGPTTTHIGTFSSVAKAEESKSLVRFKDYVLHAQRGTVLNQFMID